MDSIGEWVVWIVPILIGSVPGVWAAWRQYKQDKTLMKKTQVETDKVEAEIERTEAETEKVEAETGEIVARTATQWVEKLEKRLIKLEQAHESERVVWQEKLIEERKHWEQRLETERAFWQDELQKERLKWQVALEGERRQRRALEKRFRSAQEEWETDRADLEKKLNDAMRKLGEV